MSGRSGERDAAAPEWQPSPNRGPDAVVRTQLSAFAAFPAETAGRIAFRHAAPSLRRQTDSVDGFRDWLSDPIRRPFVDADDRRRGPTEIEGDVARVPVLATGGDATRTYEFVLEQQTAGKYEGCWMTTAIDMVYQGKSPTFHESCTVRFGDETIECRPGSTLRDVLLRADDGTPHNGTANVTNCGGNGLCGTCAVEVDGALSDPSGQERRRLSLPPHRGEDDLRLSCQATVLGDLQVRKHEGFWGQHVDEFVEDSESDTDASVIEVTDAEYDGSYSYKPES